MIQKNKHFIFGVVCIVSSALTPFVFAEEQEDYKILREIIQNEFQKETPVNQGADLTGVVRQFKSVDKKVAIVLEACLDAGADIDSALLNNLKEKQVPASLFLDQGWLQKNADQLKPWLAAGQIHIENHGLTCRPLSVTGKGVKNHSGTSGVDDVFEEVEKNARGIEAFSGRLPLFFKSGYSFYDDVALKIVTVLGYAAVEGDLKLRSSDVASDEALNAFVKQVQPGSIIVMPVNRPGTAAGWMPKLLAGLYRNGYSVVSLDDVLNVVDENR